LKKQIFFSTLFLLLLSACSTKEVYEPQVVGADWDKYESVDSQLVAVASNVALDEDRRVLTKSKLLDVKVAESQRVVALSDKWVISAAIDGNLTLSSIEDKTLQENIDLKKTIATANVKGDVLAVLFADNEIALYDIPSKTIFYREQGGKASVVDSRMVPPHFMNGLVLFLTLDGKVIIVNIELKKRLRTVIVSSEDNFNNIIYMGILDNKIIAATPYKLLSMSRKDIRAKYEIRDVVYDEKELFIATKQGEVISLTPDLQVNSKVKFPFAHFLGMISLGEKLYILEKEGYMIVLDKKSFEYSVHEVDIDDGFIFVGDKLFYVSDEKILTE
jgi:hypothetical protein